MGQGWWLEVGRDGGGVGPGGGVAQGWWLEVGWGRRGGQLGGLGREVVWVGVGGPEVGRVGGLLGRWGGLGLVARGGSGQEGRAKITSSASEASLAHWR